MFLPKLLCKLNLVLLIVEHVKPSAIWTFNSIIKEIQMKLNSFFLYLPFIFISCLLFESCFNSTKSVVGTLVGIAFDKGYIDGINQFMRMTNTDIYGGYIHRAGTWH